LLRQYKNTVLTVGREREEAKSKLEKEQKQQARDSIDSSSSSSSTTAAATTATKQLKSMMPGPLQSIATTFVNTIIKHLLFFPLINYLTSGKLKERFGTEAHVNYLSQYKYILQHL
jgi:hypothetical protein